MKSKEISLEFRFGLDVSDPFPFTPRPNAAETAPNDGDANPEKLPFTLPFPAGVSIPDANPYPNPFPYPSPKPFPYVLPKPGTPPTRLREEREEREEGEGRWRASSAARRRRLVVPRAFVDPERAEQTMATLCWSRYCLGRSQHNYL